MLKILPQNSTLWQNRIGYYKFFFYGNCIFSHCTTILYNQNNRNQNIREKMLIFLSMCIYKWDKAISRSCHVTCIYIYTEIYIIFCRTYHIFFFFFISQFATNKTHKNEFILYYMFMDFYRK